MNNSIIELCDKIMEELNPESKYSPRLSLIYTIAAEIRAQVEWAPTVYLSGRTWTEWKYPKESHKAKLICIEKLLPDKFADKNCREVEAGIVDDEFVKDTLA